MRRNYNAFFFLLFVGCVLLMHRSLQYHLFSLVPLFVVFPVVVTWVMRQPLGLLLVSGLVFELFSTLPWGSMLLISVIPYIVKRLFPSVTIDIALPFFLQLLLTISIQVSVTSLLTTIQVPTIQSITTTIPFVLLMIIAGISTLITASMCIIWEQIRAVPS